jgi:hypothetical protein
LLEEAGLRAISFEKVEGVLRERGSMVPAASFWM